ncbi:MAG: 1,4-alpha-glucan branching protein domain-containing protein [Elusimicrobiota bacterium]
MEKGYLCLVLHAHLPYIRHPEYDDFLEEDWLFEALTETYIPLLDMFERLILDGVDFRITMSLTPTLCGMFADELLQNRYLKHLDKLVELSERELSRCRNHHRIFYNTALMYNRKFKKCREVFSRYKKNLLSGFKKIQDAGKLEIITCCATHGFLPLMGDDSGWKSKSAQIKIAVSDYTEKFKKKPNGIWLAECAYYPGDDKILKENGIRYFFVETHGVLFGTPRPRCGVFAPVYCPSGVAAFARDMESAHQVWSAEIGYPGDYRYREFYRDIGYDLNYDYISPYLHSDGIRRNIGIKYYKITGNVPLSNKQPYSYDDAKEAAATHAGNFMFNREKQVEYLIDIIKRKPIVVSMYDAELFGHWWYEGPEFLEFLFKKIYYDQKTIKTITPSEYLKRYPDNQVIQPSMSSWGDKGYNEVWLNGSNDWIYRHLHKAAERMIELAQANPAATGLTKRALNQSARELVLAQSSDWAFIMTTGTMIPYALKRTKDHIYNFTKLYEQIKKNQIDEQFLVWLENKNNIFPNIDYKAYL